MCDVQGARCKVQGARCKVISPKASTSVDDDKMISVGVWGQVFEQQPYFSHAWAKRCDYLMSSKTAKRCPLQQYPRLTFRLNQQLLNRIVALSRSRHRSRGQIIREAVEMYYRVHSPASQQKITDLNQFDNQL